ncbi:MAG TPA: NrfD/PsrC family molybdoenzyme membrane anchor subunit [Planctomycetia bacterium]|nr:NrfD/PsrC family molybdoenzyme membrane anchor subunit [Planctomycetia bacterium]
MSTATVNALDQDNVTDYAPGDRPKLVLGEQNYNAVTQAVCGVVENPPTPAGWYVAFFVTLGLTVCLLFNIAYLIANGVGVWGNNIPVAWAWDIINFVFWIGIGHAGTLISAVLFIFRQPWRTSINRASEAMTLFAVVCALIFPTIHVGRIWLVYWLFPYPNQMQMWPQFRSPLLWDVFAISTYGLTSLLFWYLGLLPDLASLRDRAVGIRKWIYGLLAFGWRGSNRHWHRYERAYLLLAALATPLVLSVHSVVSFDFAVSQLPGWHTTIFPPYFVAGAIFGGFAMVNTLLVPARQFFGLKHLITLKHIDNMNKITLATGTIVGYAYMTELFIAWYSQNRYEQFTFLNRLSGPYAWAYWTMIFCNVVSPQIFWASKMRRNLWATMFVALCVDVGMWFERFVIIVTSLHRDFLPSSWTYYVPTWVDIMTFAGTHGLFLLLFLLFCRYLPMIAVAEIKAVLHHEKHHHHPSADPLAGGSNAAGAAHGHH